MNSLKLVGNVILAAICLNPAWQQGRACGQEVTKSKIAEVTIYRDQARVVRQIDIPASQELQQIRVVGLPSHLAVRSVFTEADAGTNVRSLRVVSRQVTTHSEFKTRLEQLRAKQAELSQKLRLQEYNAKAIEQDLLTIEKLVDFSAEKVKQNLDRATLDVQSVTALADFTMDRRRKLAVELLQTQTEIQQLNSDIEQNDRQQVKLNNGNIETTYEALLAVSSAGGGAVRLVYNVGNVNWSPKYNIRSTENENGERKFTLQLDAVLVQDSGEAWEDVAVTLSTSTPEGHADRPLLTPLRVRAIVPGEQSGQAVAAGSLNGNLPAWLDQTVLRRNAHLNSVANQRQVAELTLMAEVQRNLAEDAGDDLADETYPIEKRMKITNHPQLQTIAILSTDLTGKMHHVLTPLLSSFAFREAELTNSSGQNLIAGDADVYLDGNFVGRTTVPPTAAGQRLTIGFGTDRKIRTRRELLAKEETVQGGNRRSTLKHRLVITNYHETPIDIQLLDRIPLAAKDGSISVDLDAASAAALSEDPLYVRMQRPTGVLRWDLQIPAKRFGSDAFDHEYSYSIELDRQQTIVSSDLTKTMSDLEFQQMNMGGGMGGGGPF
ncbi:MAG: mucoidy inhibitor MuiA family protein [Pirellulales bacterium]|nr:mucoidy inhibitor MuiA family protein [Pirellulales bacterium]